MRHLVPGKNPLGFAAVILAAGMSPKKGRPIPLCSHLGRTLVEHVARTALASGAQEVVVVAGEHADEIRQRLKNLPVRVVQNREWQEGIAGSISLGISRLDSNPAAAIVCLCDQPRITPEHLRALATRVLEPGGPAIVASSYDGISGAPAAFKRSFFADLLSLKGEEGARHLIRNAVSPVETLCFADANEEVEVAAHAEPPKEFLRCDVIAVRFDPVRTPRGPPYKWRHPLAV